MRQANKLLVTIEAVDVNSDRLLWQASVSTIGQDMIGAKEQLTTQIRGGLLPILGAAGGFLETSTRPSSPEAYDLYLRSVAIPHDPSPNKQAIGLLEKAVAMDPSYAPAWEAIGQRYYYDGTYSDGGEPMFQRSNAALEKALALDQNLVDAAGQLVVNRIDRGELTKAYEAAQELVKRRPENARAHFAMAYAQRYAGMLEQSAKECDMAITLDPANYQFRSCAWVFMELGRFDRASQFLQLDAGSEWVNYALPSLLLRQGKIGEAREALKRMPTTPRYHRNLLDACLNNPSELDRLAREAETSPPTEADPELSYYQGAIFAYCGKKEAAFHMLSLAIELNYCAYSNLLSDPLMRSLHSDRRFDEILTAAHSCQQAVLPPS